MYNFFLLFIHQLASSYKFDIILRIERIIMKEVIIKILCFLLLTPVLILFLTYLAARPYLELELVTNVNCNENTKSCEVYSFKLYQPVLYGFASLGVKNISPKLSERLEEKANKILKEPSFKFSISDIKEFKCKKTHEKNVGKHSANVILKSGRELTFGVFNEKKDCIEICNSANKLEGDTKAIEKVINTLLTKQKN